MLVNGVKVSWQKSVPHLLSPPGILGTSQGLFYLDFVTTVLLKMCNILNVFIYLILKSSKNCHLNQTTLGTIEGLHFSCLCLPA